MSGKEQAILQKLNALPAWALQGVTLLSVFAAIWAGGIWKGHIEEKLDNNSKTLEKISDDISNSQQGIAVRLARV